MDDARLNQILEETISLLGTQFMDQISQPLGSIASNIIIDLSNSSLLTLAPPRIEETITTPEVVVENPHLSRKYQILENISNHWFRNNRDYQDINYQMNKISQHLIQNVTNMIGTQPNRTSSSPPLSHWQQQQQQQQTPFLFEVGGISLPTRRRFPVVDNDVVLYPNIRQVMAATEIYPHTANSTDLSCPLTLEDFEIGEELCRIRQCRHVFTWKYLQEWFCTNSHCPVCRYDIRDFVVTP